MNACHAFRQRLLQALTSRDALVPLSWDEHVLCCPACRALVEDEEQLDQLLAAWITPRLDAAARERIVAFVARERELDALLDEHARRDPAAAAPHDLAHRVLAALRRRLAAETARDPLDVVLDEAQLRAPEGLARRVRDGVHARRASARDADLDRLLDLHRVRAPVGLAGRVAAFVKQTRQPAPTIAQASPRSARPVLVRRIAWFAAAAAAALVASVWIGPLRDARPEQVAVPAPGPKERPSDGLAAPQGAGDLVASAPFDDKLVDERLLGQLETLEEIEALLGGDVDLLLSTMDASEEALLDLAPGEETAAAEEPKKG